MNLLKNKRILSLFVFVLFLLTGILLFIQLHNLAIADDNPGGQAYLYFTLFLILGIGLFAFSTMDQVKKVEYIATSGDTENEVQTVSQESHKNSEEKISDEKDYDSLVQSILPSDDLVKDKEKYCEKLLSNFASEFEIVQGVVFLYDENKDEYQPAGKYAYFNDEPPQPFKTGETLPGQVARNKTMLLVDDIPTGYIKVVSGLGTSSPKHLLIFPVLNDGKPIGIIELASFKVFNKDIQAAVDHLSEKLSKPFTSIIKE